MPKPTTYNAFVAKAKQLTNAGEKAQVEKMVYLLDIYHDPSLWRGTWKRSFKKILRDERLCTWTLFKNFEQASLCLSSTALRHFGVMASARIGSLTGTTRRQVLDQVQKWWEDHKVPPEYQLVTEFVKSRLPPKPKAVSRKRLIAHIKKIEQILRDNDITPPPFPRA